MGLPSDIHERDLLVLMCCDGEGEGRMSDDLVDLSGGVPILE